MQTQTLRNSSSKTTDIERKIIQIKVKRLNNQ